MGKIKQLSEEVYCQIAAGEVVERPASVLRELVDNSIDAGSDRVEIVLETDESGYDISVSDNGHGIDEEDLPLCLVRHATSKITQFEDIFSTSTRGFRGEALAAIASVSRVEITTSTHDGGEGHSLIANPGLNPKVSAASRSKGTTVRVNEIFYNTPVRQKFLKSQTGEKNEIRRELIRAVLATPNVGFKYTTRTSGKTKLEFNIPPTMSLRDRIGTLFPAKMAESLIEVEGFNGTSKIKGFITDHRFHASNRRDQFFFIRGKAITNMTLSTALKLAYTNIIPAKLFPACFLDLSFDPDFVDINVHPQKKDVKFINNDGAYSLIYHQVKNTLMRHVSEKQRDGNYTYSNHNNKVEGNQSPDNQRTFKVFADESSEFQQSSQSLATSFDQTIESSPASRPISTVKNFVPGELTNQHLSTSSISPVDTADRTGQSGSSNSNLPDFEILGQIGGVYIVYKINEELFLADQHAIHERINFDRIKARVDEKVKSNSEDQLLLLPLVFDLGRQDASELLEHTDSLKKMGLEIEAFGDSSVKIEKVPSYIASGKERKQVQAIFSGVLENRNASPSEILEKVISTTACRMSIMAGDELSKAMMHDLLSKLYQEDYIHNCPHGRPFVKKIGRGELDTYFDR